LWLFTFSATILLYIIYSGENTCFFPFFLNVLVCLTHCCTGSVRLVDGGSRCAGRVEVLHGESWFTVCDADFNQQDAEVVCRELGCGEAVDALGKSHFGSGSGPIWMDDVDCSGSEFTLKKCQRRGWVLLVNGSRCSGRVEVLHGESWFTVCDADFNQQDAEVVCRELGCGSPVEILGAAAFGRGEGPVWSEELQCRGNESQIHFCPKSSSLKHNCSHDNDVGLVCSGKSSVRLVDGDSRCAGRVEVLHGESWFTVCDADFNQQDAEVVCRELGCGSPVEVLGAAAFGRGEGPVWSEELQCRGDESEITLCPITSSHKYNCSHGNDVGLVCSGKSCMFVINVIKITTILLYIIYSGENTCFFHSFSMSWSVLLTVVQAVFTSVQNHLHSNTTAPMIMMWDWCVLVRAACL
uniref:SRCR domain-containing protein n=1 Tax=Astyanax mexicanus TaxID=7994 RepID=A0A3B1KB05_ASTMX